LRYVIFPWSLSKDFLLNDIPKEPLVKQNMPNPHGSSIVCGVPTTNVMLSNNKLDFIIHNTKMKALVILRKGSKVHRNTSGSIITLSLNNIKVVVKQKR
jgi:hypothetical protein